MSEITDIDFKRKAEQMHRRAQKAEARADRAESLSEMRRKARDYWFKQFITKRGELLKMRHQRDRLRLQQPNALARFIALGKAFP